jgi:hypothetical protein
LRRCHEIKPRYYGKLHCSHCGKAFEDDKDYCRYFIPPWSGSAHDLGDGVGCDFISVGESHIVAVHERPPAEQAAARLTAQQFQ